MIIVTEADPNIERWITMHGAKIPIFKGQTQDQAVDQFFKKRGMTDKDYTHMDKKYQDLDDETLKRLDKFFEDEQKGKDSGHGLHQFFQSKRDKIKQVLDSRSSEMETTTPKIETPRPDPSSPEIGRAHV